MNENDQKYCFESEGYLIVEQLLSEDEIRSCQNEIQTLHQKAKGYFETGDQRAGCFQLEPYMNSEKTDESQPNDYPVLRKVERTGHLSTVFFNLARCVPFIKKNARCRFSGVADELFRKR